MDYFDYQGSDLFAEGISVADLAERFGTPLYIYSRKTLERHYRAFDEALGDDPHKICYAVKANSNLAVLEVLAKLGSGFDIVSGGELARVLRVGGDMSRVVFSGVGKLEWEIEKALKENIFCFNVESKSELERINQIASKLGKKAPISFRVNPDIDANTHPYIATGLKENKFGVDIEEALALYQHANELENITIKGVDCHIGSQLTELQPFLLACKKVFALVKQLQEKNISISHLDLGGGLGVRYLNENPPLPADYAKALLPLVPDPKLEIILEPGRAIAANAGILVTKIEYIKQTPHKNFVVVDAAMNDLLRPALYHAEQAIIPVVKNNKKEIECDVVGPVCETGDFLGRERKLAVSEGDLLAVRTTGAYGFVMSSNYNTRPRVAEVMVDNNRAMLVREREKIDDLFEGEYLL